MRRRLRRRPAPRKALTPKSTKRKALGSDDSGALRYGIPLERRLSSSFLQGLGGDAIPFLRSCRGTAAPGRSAPPCFAAESARVGTLMSLPEGIATLRFR